MGAVDVTFFYTPTASKPLRKFRFLKNDTHKEKCKAEKGTLIPRSQATVSAPVTRSMYGPQKSLLEAYRSLLLILICTG